MIVPLTLPQTRLTSLVKELRARTRQRTLFPPEPPVTMPTGILPRGHRQPVAYPSNPYSLEFEDGEPTWEDAEWQ